MRHAFRYLSCFSAVYVFIILMSSAVTAQPSLWTSRSEHNTIGVELLIPDFRDNVSSYSGFVLTLSSGIHISARTHLIVELPVVHGSYSSLSFNRSVTVIGNPYLGIMFTPLESKFWGEVGIRVPFIPEDENAAISVGVLTDVERIEAYVPDMLQISGAVNFSTPLSSELGIRLRLGPAIDIVTVQNSNGDAFLHYAALLQYYISSVTLQGGYAAKTLITQSGVNNRTRDFIEFHGSGQINRVRPGIQIRLPLDEFDKTFIEAIYGLSLEFVL